MKKFLRFSLVVLFAVLGTSNAMAEDIIWQEDWTGYSIDVLPSNSNYSFSGTVFNEDNSIKSGTKLFDANLAGGTAPELMIAKSVGSFTATVSLGGKTGDFILTFLTNRNDLKVEVTGGTLGDKKRSGNSDSYAITDVTETSLTIKFYMTSNSNARLDNIKLYQGTAKQNPGLSWGKASASVEFENQDDYEKYLPKLQNPYELTLTCTSSDETVATVTNDGTISVRAAGKTTLTASFEGNDDYEAQTVTCELTVTVKKADAELAFSEEEVTVTLGDDFTAPTLTNPHAVEVVYSSSKTEVAEVDATTGEVTIKAAGTTKITAKVPSTNEEYDGSASYTLTVKEPATEAKVIDATVAEALDVINGLENGAKTTDQYKVTGYVVGAPDFQRDKENKLYGNVNLEIADEAGGTTTLTIFRAMKDADMNKFTEDDLNMIKEGDKVVFQGVLQKYVKNDVMTPELSGGYLVSVTSGIHAVTIDDANAPAYSLDGRRVDESYHGVVIKNGKKYVK